MFLPEYEEHAGNGTLVAVISFSGTRQNHRGLNETDKECRMFLTVKNCSTGQALAHYDESIRPGSTIILAVFGSLALTQAEKSGNNAG